MKAEKRTVKAEPRTTHTTSPNGHTNLKDLKQTAKFDIEVKRSLDALRVREEAQRRLRTGKWSEPRRLNLTGPRPPEPERMGVAGWLQRPALVWLSGEPETGKSLVAYEGALVELRAGRNVILLDAEAGSSDIQQKLMGLGATKQQLSHFYAYESPPDLLENANWLIERVGDLKPRYVIFDSAAPILAASGLDDETAHDVVLFYAVVLQPLLAEPYECCVVMLDHKPKADPTSRYARGSGTKLQVSDLGYTAIAPEPFARGRSGRLRLICEKDRSGYVGRGTEFNIQVLVTEDGSIDLDGQRINRDQVITVKKSSEAASATLVVLDESAAPLTTEQVAKKLKVEFDTAFRRLTRLEKDGKARRISQGRGPDGQQLPTLWEQVK